MCLFSLIGVKQGKNACADPENYIRGILMTFFFLFVFLVMPCHALRTSLKKQLHPMGPIASRGRSVPEFLRTPIATCDFLGSPDPMSPFLDPPMK